MFIPGIIIGTIFCGKAPVDSPAIKRGSIQITALVDSTQIDSMVITLDDESLGLRENPYIIEDVEIGTHQIFLSMDDPTSPIDYQSQPKQVFVKENVTSSLLMVLTKYAPGFSLNNIYEQSISLSDFQGKVVLLEFFEHT